MDLHKLSLDIGLELYNKSFYVNKKKWMELVTYILMVMMDIRQAYLIDCCFIEDVNVLQRMISSIHDKVASLTKHTIFSINIIVISVDFIIIRHDSLLQKLIHLNSNVKSSNINDWHHYHPLIVDINGSNDRPCLCNTDMISLFQQNLIALTSSWINAGIGNSQVLHLVNEDKVLSQIGSPFIAGWLLGYPCIYHLLQSNESNNDIFMNCLSMQPLIKYSILGLYNIENNSHTVDILEFTVPKLILDENPSLVSILSERISERIHIIKLNMISATNSATPLLSDIILKKEEFTLSSYCL